MGCWRRTSRHEITSMRYLRLKQPATLRARLTAIILFPLLSVAVLVGLWQLSNARRTAAEVFDRSLLSAAMAVINDVAVSGGDALSERTQNILAETSGGQVFYHVYAPDGVIVAGYATPPVGIPSLAREAAAQPTYFEGTYLGRTVSGVRLQLNTEIDGFSGVFTTTIWQDRDVRIAFVRSLILRTLVVILILVASLAMIVWFGVKHGLRPLLELENAIARRSTRDLSPIQRRVPEEAKGIVATLNRLFGQVSYVISSQSEFIANAAHQLQNPIAGVLSLAEAVVDAPSAQQQKSRAQELLDAAQDTADLSRKLLMMDRADALTPQATFCEFNLSEAIAAWVGEMANVRKEDIEFILRTDDHDLFLRGDELMLKEAVRNLVDNALRHGGQGVSKITVSVQRMDNEIEISVEDNGHGLDEQYFSQALSRFTQISKTSSSGLGLSIAKAVAEGHRGRLELCNLPCGFRAQLILPYLPCA